MKAGGTGDGALIAAIGDAVREMTRRPALRDKSVHAARKAVKKARAVLRLLRDSVGAKTYARENAALRDAGRCLSPVRDAKSLVDAFEALRQRHPGKLDHARALASQLRARSQAMRRNLLRTPGRLSHCVLALEACRARLRQSAAADRHADGAIAGLRRIHRAGRRALVRAKRAGTAKALHEWRKQVKYLENALMVFDVPARSGLARIEEQSKTLADKLGEDHDLAELAGHVTGLARLSIDGVPKDTLVRLIERRRAKLQKQAFTLGAKIYEEKSGRFARQLKPQDYGKGGETTRKGI